MTTRILYNQKDKEQFKKLLDTYKLPCTVTLIKGKNRSVEQNKLQRLWVNEISEQRQDHTPEEIRGYCKLHFGIPILRNENEQFRQQYDKIVKPLSYEDKLSIMMEPLDFPVTRLMTTGQNTRYLDAVYHHFTAQGMILTVPG